MERRLKYLHEETNPIVPGLGDVRFVPILKFYEKTPRCEILVAKCTKILDHHVVYSILEKNEDKAIPFELAKDWGMLSIDECIKFVLNSYMKEMIASSNVSSEDSQVMFSKSSSEEISNYFEKLKNLVLLSRNVLKEAEKAKNVYQKEIEEK